jgi:hypothetical protein
VKLSRESTRRWFGTRRWSGFLPWLLFIVIVDYVFFRDQPWLGLGGRLIWNSLLALSAIRVFWNADFERLARSKARRTAVGFRGKGFRISLAARLRCRQ